MNTDYSLFKFKLVFIYNYLNSIKYFHLIHEFQLSHFNIRNLTTNSILLTLNNISPL